MSLDASRLSSAIRSALVATPYCADNAALTSFCNAFATAIVAEITGHAAVTVNVIAPGTPGLAAPPGGGPVTGSTTASGTVA